MVDLKNIGGNLCFIGGFATDRDNLRNYEF